jgi:hypothetical protein
VSSSSSSSRQMRHGRQGACGRGACRDAATQGFFRARGAAGRKPLVKIIVTALVGKSVPSTAGTAAAGGDDDTEGDSELRP